MTTLTMAPLQLEIVGDEPTLDEVLAGVWEGLIAHRVVQCPVCRAEMVPEYGAHALPLGGRCTACGSTVT